MLERSPFRQPHVPWTAPGGIDHAHRDMTATASADVTLHALQARLATHNQWLPIDGPPSATLGQLVSANSTGPLRLGYGAWRDLLLGAQFLNGDDQLITAGGRTVKNVAGYDLTKFMVGQRGIFGRLVTVTLRTYRRPAAALLATFAPDQRTISHLLPTSLRPQWTILTPEHLYCGYLADASAIAYYQARLAEHRPLAAVSRSVEQDVEHRLTLWSADPDNSFRASVPPARVAEFAHLAHLQKWTADAAFGIVIGPTTDGSQDDHEHQERIHSAAMSLGGSAFFNKPGGQVDYYPSEQQDRILAAIKDALDPEHRLNPL